MLIDYSDIQIHDQKYYTAYYGDYDEKGFHFYFIISILLFLFFYAFAPVNPFFSGGGGGDIISKKRGRKMFIVMSNRELLAFEALCGLTEPIFFRSR